jgi:nitrous oxide reductase accessory protein NosL
MVIEKHPGPNGQVFFRDNAPQGHDNPARFDALKQCMFPYLWEKQSLGWKASAIYVTDYSSIDYNVNTQGGNAYMSSHPEKEAFAKAEDLYYAVNSDVQGAMGYDFMPFSVESDATAYAEEWGGQVVRFGEIDEALVGK